MDTTRGRRLNLNLILTEAEPAGPNSTDDGNTKGPSSETESGEAHEYRDYQ